MKTCSKCGIEKPNTAEYFNKKSNKKKATCKICKYKYIKEWQEKNKEKVKKYKGKYKKTHKEEIKIKDSEYYKRSEVRERQNVHNVRQRSLRGNVITNFTLKDWKQCKEYFNYECAYCGESTKLEFDHLIPVIKKGATIKGNIVCSCRSCNARKHKSEWEGWFKLQTFFNQERYLKILKHINSLEEVEK